MSTGLGVCVSVRACNSECFVSARRSKGNCKAVVRQLLVEAFVFILKNKFRFLTLSTETPRANGVQ